MWSLPYGITHAVVWWHITFGVIKQEHPKYATGFCVTICTLVHNRWNGLISSSLNPFLYLIMNLYYYAQIDDYAEWNVSLHSTLKSCKNAMSNRFHHVAPCEIMMLFSCSNIETELLICLKDFFWNKSSLKNVRNQLLVIFNYKFHNENEDFSP